MSDRVIEALGRKSATDDVVLESLRERLLARAADDALVDVTYRTVDSPVGRLLVAATDAGLVRVAYESEDHDHVLASLATSIGSRILKNAKGFDEIARELDDYFAGRRRTFDVPVDLRLARGFRLEVLHHLQHIPYGSTESYGQVALAAGNPRAVRAVGTACATNPLPLVVPCHRVVRSDGTLGGYLGGLAAKEYLLALESAAA
ncbi:cysteine methyltransferase [Intrasporangium oryzae NRRL B-24470]|uniref:Methylated-DNA--protein-cysteine methyltransferase n=1 Tax=Intrasporangium oryzae NRRL B-24470 TaxID=1386089 RepID=W9GCQ2_9MICO|nr:methylated-DNA--[protein]-cysteine S-methyltransferase [Intrasporangium oryzae]EWT02593.1 cysteine methyltransferase [Intrasporangium oryzae NRRL B-24470]